MEGRKKKAPTTWFAKNASQQQALGFRHGACEMQISS